MEREQTYFRELVEMINGFCGYAIDLDCFSTMFDSSLIMESLSYINSLYQGDKLSLNDTQEVKKIFHNNFIFFSEKSSKQAKEKYNKDFFLISTFFSLSLIILGIGCFYLPLIFIPLICIFSMSWFVSCCVMKTKNYLFHLNRETNFPDELLHLKCKLTLLKNELVGKYTVNCLDNHDSVASCSTKTTQHQKKLVTFSLVTKINLFSIESFDSNLSVNIGENEIAPQL